MEPLITDDLILERSKIWSSAMASFCEQENYKELDFKEIQSESAPESDDVTPNETVQSPGKKEEDTCKALVKVENFEGNTSSDDFDECTNQTIATMKEHQEKWEKCGMMKVLETFDLDKINKVVTPWVEKNKLDKTQFDSTSVDEHIVHIEEHHHRQIHVASDDDSLHSLDTANYIRSSRKKRLASCTTTTIKKFSYVKGSKKNPRMNQNFAAYLDMNKELDRIFKEKYPKVRSKPKEIKASEGRQTMNFTPPSRQQYAPPEPMSLPAATTTRRRRLRQLKRRSNTSKRSVSSSSSSSSSPVRHVRPKYKRFTKSNVKDSNSKSQNHESEDREEKSPEPTIDLTKLDTSVSGSEAINDRKINSPPKPPSTSSKANQEPSLNNETGFLGASLINSTAVTSNPNPPSTKKCVITPIKNNPKQEKYRLIKRKKPSIDDSEKPEEIEETKVPEPKVPEVNRKILLYEPTNPETHKKNLKGKRFHVTREYFVEKVGEKNSNRFIKLNSSKFPFKFDSTSRVYFKIPDESEESASSDEDILSLFGREGAFVVEAEAEEEKEKNDTN